MMMVMVVVIIIICSTLPGHPTCSGGGDRWHSRTDSTGRYHLYAEGQDMPRQDATLFQEEAYPR